MIVLDRLLIGGIGFVLDKLATAVDAELNDDTALREELLALQMRYELGEIGDEELAARERVLLDRLRELRPPAATAGAISFGGGEEVEVEIGFAAEEAEPGRRDESVRDAERGGRESPAARRRR
jgi:hypothetical protein